MPLGRQDRIDEVKRRFDEELAFTHAANRCYEQYRVKGRMRDGRRFGAPPHPYEPPLVPEGKINTTDPTPPIGSTRDPPAIVEGAGDSRLVITPVSRRSSTG